MRQWIFLLLLASCATQLPTDPEEYLAPRVSPVEASTELLKTTPKDSPEYPALLLRHCDALDQATSAELRKLAALEEALYQRPPNEAELFQEVAQQVVKRNEARAQSLACYQELVSGYPGFERRAEALYMLGFLFQTQGRAAEVKTTYETLLREFPKSQYAPAALLGLADEAFNGNDILLALELYKKIEAFPEAREYGYALYKKAWCLYNLADFKEALLAFVQVLSHEQDKGGETALAKEARKDIARVYANLGAPAKAESFFLSLKDPAQVGPMLKRLASIYYDIGKYKELRELCQANTATYPELRETCDQKTP